MKKSKKHTIEQSKTHAIEREWPFWAVLLAAGSIFALTFLSVCGNIPQKYKDIIIEYVAWVAGNKSAEMQLLYILIGAGCAAILIYYCYRRSSFTKTRTRKVRADAEMLRDDGIFFAMCAICITAGIYYFAYQGFSPVLSASVILAMILLCIDKDLFVPGIIFYYSSFYGAIALYRVYALFGGETAINEASLTIVASLLSLMILISTNRRTNYIRGTMAVQIMIPCLLLVFFQTKYRYNGEILHIDIPTAAKVFSALLILLLTGTAIYNLYKDWKNAANIGSAIALGSCIAIMAFNRFSGTGALMPSDLHHSLENVVDYSQVFELGQIPFRDYTPISGMYGILEGAVFSLFGGGTLSNFQLANNIFFTICIVVLIVLLWLQIDRQYIFLLAVFLQLPEYNRTVMILPIMLLLTSSKLIKNCDLWLKAWFLSSLIHGLYYPLYGVAVCLAFLPMGIVQIRRYIVSGELKRNIRRKRFWITWVLCILPAVICIPFLWGTLKHMLAMSGQSICADGITRFAQRVPDNFMPYISGNITLRTTLYYLFTFMIPAVFVWVSFCLTVRLSGITFEKRKLRVADGTTACIGIACVIMMIISYTYTAVRLDVGTLFSRNMGPMLSGGILMLVYIHKYNGTFGCKSSVSCLLFLICALAPLVGIMGNDYKLSYCYDVPEGYIYVENDQVEKLGTGFMDETVYQDVESQWQETLDLDRERAYFGAFSDFGYNYLYGVKGASTIAAATIRDFNSASEAVETVRRADGYVGKYINPLTNYYILNWVLTSGEYYWDSDQQVFAAVDGTMDPETVRQKNLEISIATDCYGYMQTAGAFGNSMKTLKDVFIDPGYDIDVVDSGMEDYLLFSETIDGDDADFLYLEFADIEKDIQHILYDFSGDYAQPEGSSIIPFTKERENPDKTVLINWADDNGGIHRMFCALGNGKLLIPLGAGERWLLQHHDGVIISLVRGEEELDLPEISSAKLLKLREVA